MATKKKEKHICSECIGEFEDKDIYTADVPDAMLPHSTNYCLKCIKKLGIEEYKPYLKPRAPRKKKAETEKTTAKTKNSTTAKTKNSTTKRTTRTKK